MKHSIQILEKIKALNDLADFSYTNISFKDKEQKKKFINYIEFLHDFLCEEFNAALIDENEEMKF